VNKIIEKYFQSIELALVTHSHVTDYNVINMKIVNDTGKIWRYIYTPYSH